MKHSRQNHSTKYIALNTHLCQACWACVEACPNDVLGKIDFFFHKHAKIVHAQECKGCLKCVKACQNQAITPFKIENVRRSQQKTRCVNQIHSGDGK